MNTKIAIPATTLIGHLSASSLGTYWPAAPAVSDHVRAPIARSALERQRQLSKRGVLWSRRWLRRVALLLKPRRSDRSAKAR